MPKRIVFRVHALERMFERGIGVSEVVEILDTGETIALYEDDRPYASRLVLGWSGGRPLHIVAADAATDQITVVITVYQPDSNLWTSDFRSRR